MHASDATKGPEMAGYEHVTAVDAASRLHKAAAGLFDTVKELNEVDAHFSARIRAAIGSLPESAAVLRTATDKLLASLRAT
jgi:hypothetical protein